ncbi:hypothetical protein DF049_12480 [Burkholderia cenocepacia]|uniref:Uncharacterized protein n=1 Tax=Burkholderia cenocepacia TaxID=95486 RepID=A0A3R9D8P1_9BURK|nr:hypothetical protein DK10_032130 [Burkholderia cenocepacia]RQU79108.1 hypothetical protein DF049_12480 [Burkholderia cenocepacia]RSC11227.1 hypothetical protein EGT41_22000 [Burkholderia cenocepacia]
MTSRYNGWARDCADLCAFLASRKTCRQSVGHGRCNARQVGRTSIDAALADRGRFAFMMS